MAILEGADLVFNLTLLSLGEVALVWWSGPFADRRFYLAASLIAITLVAFWGALATRRLYAARSEPGSRTKAARSADSFVRFPFSTNTLT